MKNSVAVRRLISPILVMCTMTATFAAAFTQSVSAASAPTPNWVAPVINGSALVAAGSNGSSYSLGTITTNTTFGSNSVAIVGAADVVLVKRLADGTVSWVLRIEEATNQVGAGAIAVDSSDNIYIRGNISAATATFGSITVTSVNNSGYLAKINSAGVVQWVRLMSSGTHLHTTGVSVDNATGDIYATGRHTGLTAGTVVLSAPSPSSIDAFVVKYDSSGNAIWGKSWGGIGTDIAHRVHVQDSSNIIVSGSLGASSVAGATTVAFDAVETFTLAGVNSLEGYVAKMNSTDGSFIWANKSTGTGNEEIQDAKTDSAGNVLVVGWFGSTSLTVGSSTLTNYGGNDVWLAKFNSSGQFQWVKQGGGSDVDAGFSIVIDASDNVYVSGYFGAFGATTKNAVFGTTTLVTAGIGNIGDGFIASYSSSGAFRWALSTETAASHGYVQTLGLSDNGTLFAAATGLSGNLVVGPITTTYSGTSGATIISFADAASAATTTTSTIATTTTTSTIATTTTIATNTTVATPSLSGNPVDSTTGTTPSGIDSKRNPDSASTATTSPSVASSTDSSESAATSTTTTTTVVPDAPEVSLGAAGVVVGGKSAATTITRSGNTILVAGGGIEALIYGKSADGERIELDKNGDLRLTTEDNLVVEAKGFENSSAIDVWMYSTPTRLGKLRVAGSGSGIATFALPETVDEGEHRIVLDGDIENGQDVVVGLGIAVGALSENSISSILIIGPLTLAILFAILLPSVLKRRRKEQIA